MERIVLYSRTFLPNVGGLENVMAGLADNWHRKGYEVIVHTNIPSNQLDLPYTVKRKESIFSLFKDVRKNDIFLEANISLHTFWVGLFFRGKWFVTHQLPYDHDTSWKGKLKKILTKFSNNISCSVYVANKLSGKSVVIPNFYNPSFKKINNHRTTDLVFLGRLVSDKGTDLLIDAIHLLKNKGEVYTLSIIGDGPKKEKLLQKVNEYKIAGQVSFKGVLRGDALVDELNQHKVLVVPSKWEEPYGIVALEGMACGCLVVCSSGGGLAEATNGFGLVFERNNTTDLANKIQFAIKKYPNYILQQSSVDDYLATRTASVVADEYLNTFKQVLQS
jgi:glycosyltransferase involved in cell wall biosynthesis